MIIQFTVENFLSFKEPATLSLAASALKEKQTRSDEIVFELEGTNLSFCLLYTSPSPRDTR